MDVQCGNCGAKLLVEAHLRTTLCPYCGSSSVLDRAPSAEQATPAYALGFTVDRARAYERVRSWLKGRTLFARSGFRRAALEGVRGVYLPAWLYSAVAETGYQATIGEDYQETEHYTTTVNGKTVRKTRTVRKTEWRPLAGRRSEYLAEILVSASKGLPNEELEQIEPFEFGELRRYTPALLSGWIAEEPTRAPEEGLRLARAEALVTMKARLERFLPGDSHRDLHFDQAMRHESLDLCLVPVWVMAARYRPDAEPVRVLVNGQTGAIWGRTPLSWGKITAAVVTALGLIAGLVWFLSQR